MISGANHLEFARDSRVAETVKLGPELMGANPYPVKRARPFWSMMTFACCHGVSAAQKLGSNRKLNAAAEHQEDDLPPLNLRGECRTGEDILVPLRHQTATSHEGNTVSEMSSLAR